MVTAASTCGILALKIALAFYMFLVVWLRRRSASTGTASGSDHFWPRVRRAATSTTTLLILGVVIIGLADVLSAVGGHGDGGHDHGGQTEEVEAKDHIDDPDASDDHHKGEEVVDEEEVEVTETPEPTEEAKEEEEGDDGHHGDEDEEQEDEDDDGHGHSH